MLRPSIVISPCSKSISRLTSFIAVVLPAPEGPTSTQISPAGIVAGRERAERRVRGASLDGLDERRELGGDSAVHLDEPRRPVRRNQELDVEEAAVEAERGQEPLRDGAQLADTLGGERGGI